MKHYHQFPRNSVRGNEVSVWAGSSSFDGVSGAELINANSYTVAHGKGHRAAVCSETRTGVTPPALRLGLSAHPAFFCGKKAQNRLSRSALRPRLKAPVVH